MSKQRNPVLAGAVGLIVVIAVVAAALNFEKLPLIGGGPTYSAEFTEAAGLKPGDEVRIAGVKAGNVSDMALDGRHVRVDFHVDDQWVGDRTTASIEIKTLMGQKYLALDPRGDEALDTGTPIPAERTRAPYHVTDALSGLATTTGQIDTKQLAQSFQVMSDTFRGSPAHVNEALNGLTALSQTISSRDEEIAKLLDNASRVSKIAADRDAEFQKIISDGNLLLGEIRARKEAVSALLSGVRALSAQLRGVVADNEQQMAPALSNLDRLTGMLQRNQADLERGLAGMAPFARVFANAVGNGAWFDAYICGLIPPTIQSGPVNVNPQGCEPPIVDQAKQQGGPR